MSAFRSGTPMFACDEELRIVIWNEAAEKLTGIKAEDAVGSRCWQLLRGHDDRGALVCHQGCSTARLAREGWPVSAHDLNIRTPTARRIGIDVVSISEGPSFLMLHLLRRAEQDQRKRASAVVGPCPILTERQLEVLELLDSGLTAHEISRRLQITLTTVRNHIHAILVQLGAHSQVQALARARALGLLGVRGQSRYGE